MAVMSMHLFVLLFFMLVLGVPVAVALGFSSLIILMYYHPVPFCVIPQMLWSGTESFILVAVPFFIMAGIIMESGKISDKLIDFSNAIFSWSKGGLGAANIIASFIFGGISGSSVADTAAIGSIMIPKMTENGYDRDYSSAITVISSTLAVVVPPSILIVVLGAIAEQSIARLLIGGIIPGAMMAGSMLIQNFFISKKRDYGTYSKFSIKNIWNVSKKSLSALGAPVIIIGGILTGTVTPTEAGGLAVYYTIFISLFVLKTLNWKIFYKLIIDTAKITASVMFVVSSARLFTFIISYENLPQIIANYLFNLTHSPLILLLLINVFLLIVGMIMDGVVAIIMLAPILFPIVMSAGIDPIHFGVLFVINLAIGLVTPPFGVCLFSVCSVSKIKMEKLVKAAFPLYLSLIVVLLIVTLFPQIVVFLPNLMFN
ncbi:TRAP transporter large permease [Halocella sp. SP3-1]|uniref:TRAP transporter large permease n=1 Tax=Halocella sp. SP3-1 TaxID=2382161 RepID=UPI000F755FFD|nr:TRAP transporter large permease [Halocella sp. SP3-1]AZO93656.1 TRAP transporter large permease [Halocella sp. SP3-1]